MSIGTRFRLESTHSGALSILGLYGEFDAKVAGDLAQAVQAGLSRDPLIVIVDLRGLTFIDSAGIRALIGAGQVCQARRRQFFLIRGLPAIDRQLRASGLDGPFELVSDLDHLGVAA